MLKRQRHDPSAVPARGTSGVSPLLRNDPSAVPARGTSGVSPLLRNDPSAVPARGTSGIDARRPTRLRARLRPGPTGAAAHLHAGNAERRRLDRQDLHRSRLVVAGARRPSRHGQPGAEHRARVPARRRDGRAPDRAQQRAGTGLRNVRRALQARTGAPHGSVAGTGRTGCAGAGLRARQPFRVQQPRLRRRRAGDRAGQRPALR